MKKPKILIPILIGLLSLTSCSFIELFPNSSSEEPSNSETSSDTESVEEEKPEGEVVKSRKLIDKNSNNYHVGDIYSQDNQLALRYTYESGKIYDELLESYTINMIKYTDENVTLEKDSAFSYAGAYRVSVSYLYEGANKTGVVTFDVKSGIYADNYSLETFEFNEPVNYTIGEKLSESNITYNFLATWSVVGENRTIEEIFPYRQYQEDITISLVKEGTTADVYDQVLEGDTTYVFSAYLNKYPTIAAKSTFFVSAESGYYLLEESALVYSEFNDVSLHTGNANMIVILIDFEPGSSEYTTADWTTANTTKVDNYFFGAKEDTPNGWNSLKTYYEQTSLGEITISGDLFGPVKTSYTVADVQTGNDRRNMLNEAINKVKQTYTDVDWTEYDRNNDGFFDNLHFVTNYTNVSHGGPLWPHKYSLYNSAGTPSSPNGGVYEISTIDPSLFKDPTTFIHEQGHMFGIPDYYDYSYSGVDYVGQIDMQSHNVFDWNSWSKFSVGWANPIVVNGKKETTKITFKSASTTNQCVVIPANIDTYNNSAFDEYFLIELVTNEGNNTRDWPKYISQSVNAAVRIYHIDARLWNVTSASSMTNVSGYLVDDVEDAKTGSYVTLRTSNTYNYGEYADYCRKEDHDFKLISLIQKGGVDTFGQTSSSVRHQLSLEDMFRTGDTFDFDTYKHFLSKTGKTVTTMDNGETFPYSIYFNYVGVDGCTITITK